MTLPGVGPDPCATEDKGHANEGWTQLVLIQVFVLGLRVPEKGGAGMSIPFQSEGGKSLAEGQRSVALVRAGSR